MGSGDTILGAGIGVAGTLLGVAVAGGAETSGDLTVTAIEQSVDLFKWNMIEWRGGTALTRKPLKWVYFKAAPALALEIWGLAKKIPFSVEKEETPKTGDVWTKKKFFRIRSQYPVHEQINGAWMKKELKKAKR